MTLRFIVNDCRSLQQQASTFGSTVILRSACRNKEDAFSSNGELFKHFRIFCICNRYIY